MSPTGAGLDAKDLILADIEHFGESFWRNEESGEKRLTFFVTLVTAVGSGLVAIATSERPPRPERLREIAAIATGLLLAVGALTYLRMIRRNLVTDSYVKTLKHLRTLYRDACPGLERYEVPLAADSWARDWPRGGYAETVAVLNGLLTGALSFFSMDVGPSHAAMVGVLTASALWVGAVQARTQPAARPARHFRAGVGAVIVNEDGLVLALERCGIPGAWQLPQGGIEEHEDAQSAVYREVGEETGIAKVALTPWATYPEPLAYELPARLQKPKTGMGQVHRWFFFRYAGPRELAPPPGEFHLAAWRPLEQVAREVVDFRRPVYERLSAFLGELRARDRERGPTPRRSE